MVTILCGRAAVFEGKGKSFINNNNILYGIAKG